MGEVFSFFLINNYGMCPKNFNNHNAVMDKDGFMVLIWVDASRMHRTIRISEGSNVTESYEDTVVTNFLNRYGTAASLDYVGPALFLGNMPKSSNIDNAYLAILGDDIDYHNAIIYNGVLETDGTITWSQGIDYFATGILINGSFSACMTNQVTLLYGINATEDLICGRYSMLTQGRYSVQTETSYYYTELNAAFCQENGNGGCLAGKAAASSGPTIELAYSPFSHVDSSFGSPTEIIGTSGLPANDFIENIDVAYDAVNECIGGVYSVYDDSESELVFKFLCSDDDGATWETQTISRVDSGDYIGAVSTEAESKLKIMSGAEGGFIIGYTALNNDATPVARPYVHTVDFGGSGVIYTINAGKECGQALAKYDATTPMIGPVFFRPPAERYVNIDPIGEVYIAYQLGEGNDFSTSHQECSKAMGMAFEKLSEVAYPAAAASTYAIDTAETDEFVVPINIVGSTRDTQDFYTNGFVGEYTDHYVQAFNKHGTTITLSSYEPRDDIYIGGRAAYNDATEYAVKVFLDPQSWTSPNAELSQSDFEDYISRDLRKIFFPPNVVYMEISENTSQSETKQYTIWTVDHNGYTYEIRQITPRFINNQLCYWEANCYNTGNFSVWSRGGGY